MNIWFDLVPVLAEALMRGCAKAAWAACGFYAVECSRLLIRHQHHGHSRTAAVEKPKNDVKMLHIIVVTPVWTVNEGQNDDVGINGKLRPTAEDGSVRMYSADFGGVRL
ncbi:hypothetical protein DFH08DRAFT_811156 [Mycena albidolilacea]|uniref:Uncharacterized protein n=1 Tax=Mycena albidolilacea TaxID=1033008 RepID=A0AAD6ZWB8_9AGAR|nr:hypothetical protein DFH08DRAFT_811156 [Mycena albidolilacea]